MKIEHFENIDYYRQTVQDYLLHQEAAHGWMLGFCSRKKHQHLPYTTVVTQDNTVLGTAIVSLPDMLVLSKFLSQEGIQRVASDLIAHNTSLTGVIAPKPEAIAFAQRWQFLIGKSYRLNMAQRVYQLEKVKLTSYASGSLRLATKSDRSLLIEWVKAFEQEALGEIRTEEQYQDWYDIRLNNNSLYVWQNDVLVSMAGFSGSTPNGIKINSVYTPPEYRGQGYASSCVATLSQISLDRGNKYCFLSTDLANSTSNSVYQKIGYQAACDVDNYLFED